MKIFDVNKNGKVEFWEFLVIGCVGYTVIDLGLMLMNVFV